MLFKRRGKQERNRGKKAGISERNGEKKINGK